MSKLKNISWSILGQGGGAFFGFLNFVLLNRQLSKSEFGQWILIFSALSLLEMVRTGFSQSAVLKLSGSGVKSEPKVWGSLISFLFNINLYSTGFILVFGALMFELFGLSWHLVFPLVLIWWAQGGVFVDLWYLQYLSNFKSLTFLKIAVLIPFTVILSLGIIDDLELILWAYGVSHLLGWLLFRIRKGISISYLKSSEKRIKKYFRLFGIYSLGTQLGSNLLRSSDSFLIGIFLGDVWVGTYAVAFKILELAEVPIRAVSLVLQRQWSQVEKKKEVYKNYFINVLIYTLFGVAPCVALLMFPEAFIAVLGGDKYLKEALPVFVMLIPVLLILPADRFSGVALDMIGKPKANMVKVMCMLIVNVIGDLIVLKLGYGIEAVAAVSIATFGSGVVFGVLRLRHHTT